MIALMVTAMSYLIMKDASLDIVGAALILVMTVYALSIYFCMRLSPAILKAHASDNVLYSIAMMRFLDLETKKAIANVVATKGGITHSELIGIAQNHADTQGVRAILACQ